MLFPISGPRAIFLCDLFTHKEINICGHIYYLFTKYVTKRNSRTILQFPSLIVALIAGTRLKFLSGLTMVTRDHPISAQTMTQSKAHITGPTIGISQIPRDDVEEEGGGHGGRDRAVHISPGGLYITLFPSTCTSTYSS